MHPFNEYDVENILHFSGENDRIPVTQKAARILGRLVDWTNSNSDGWMYWQKPRRAARNLEQLFGETYESTRDLIWAGEDEDMDEAALKKALIPIKSFMTRHTGDKTAFSRLIEGE